MQKDFVIDRAKWEDYLDSEELADYVESVVDAMVEELADDRASSG